MRSACASVAPVSTSTRTAVAKSRSAPASVPSASVSRPSRRRICRPFRVKPSRSVPATAIASVTRKIAVRPPLRRQRRPHRGGRHVHAVGDQPGPHPLGVERRPDQPRLAVSELAHGVEEMRHHPRPRREGLRRLLRRRLAVPEAHHRPRRPPAPRSAPASHSPAPASRSAPAAAAPRPRGARGRASPIGRISRGSCAPLRRTSRCGPSRCSPRKPGTPSAAAATPASTAARVISGVSVISVGRSPVVPSPACAAQIRRMPSRLGLRRSASPRRRRSPAGR